MEFQFPAINYLYLVACAMAVALAVFSVAQTHNAGARLWVGVMVGCAALMPVVPNMLYVAGIDIAVGNDPTSIFFVLSAVLVTLATQQYRFLTLAPVARDLVFDSVNIADVNPAFTEISGDSFAVVVGRPVTQVFSKCFDGIEVTQTDASWQGRLTARSDSRQFDVTSML